MRSIEMSAKTVEAAVQAACEALGVDRDDINVSYEVLEFPARKLFKTIPAKVLVKVEEPEVEEVKPVEDAPAPVEAPAVPAEEAAPAVEPAAEESAEAPVEEDASADEEVSLDIAADPRLQAAVDYLTPIFKLMGVEEFSFTAVKKGEATILRVIGEHMGALIGRRGETMESLSYLASLVANRLEGDYIKLGLDVAGYRDKRESDLTALAQRIGAKVRRTGRSFAMEPMNPYERRIIHSAIGKMEGVRSESKGEGRDRRVVIYSTDPNAVAESANARPRGPRGGRDRNGNGRNGGYHRGGERRGDRNGRGPRNGGGRGGYRSNVPERTYTPRDAENAAPVAPKRTERVDDFADLSFGKIEL